ncbi:lysozyme inhibitor LprI family protein [Trinickia mobilis]|uniref:lysozyme inhibitor LprI family protein n=1 Tax=Trinickia mobilis TaxID=2816356 RepID=UPI001A8ECADC|nr:lysozyme inhibitor LprI family protein [Trinickia mobilis]
MIKKPLFLLPMLLMLPMLAAAAGFDCSKAKSPAEQRICADPLLTKMDRDLSDAYQQVLKPPAADAWKADQRAWLADRNRCGNDDGCLRRQYAERLTVLRAGNQPFQWDAHWWRVDSSGLSSSELIVREVTKRGFEFEISAWAGANSGELLGKASLDAADAARYRGDEASDTQGCVLTFKRVLNHLEVDQKGDAPMCGAGLDVYYDGTYVAADRDPNAKPDLISRGVP